MQPKSARNPKLCANIAIISTAILLGYLLIQRFFIPQDLQPNQTPNETAKGKKISLPKTVWNENQKALLLVLQKGFKFCTKIMPFYESTVEKASEKGIKLIAVLPNSREESQQYLKENGMEIREIRQA